jgi:replicative DNA helicase
MAARPSVGKTAFAETIADHWATGDGFPVLFASIEMSLSQLMDRAVSRTAGIPAQHLVRGTLSADEEVLAAETVERRKAVKIWYYDDGYATTETLRAQAARCAMVNGGIRGIVVDYLQILKDAGDQEVQRVTKISRNIKALAREYDCPVLALSQLNRQSEYRPDPHPRLADIRESGAIEQDADVVLGLYRDRAMEDSFDGSDLEVDILKNRQGPSQMRVVIPFHGETVSFERE